MRARPDKRALLEQIAVCEGIIHRLKARVPQPLPLLAAVGDVLAGLESELATIDAADPAGDT